VEDLILARIRCLHREVIVILADSSSQGEALVAEEGGTQEETADDTVKESTAGKQ
jgi:hypothetical protein